MSELSIEYDGTNDVLHVEGQAYSGELFRVFARIGISNQLLKARRNADGVVSFSTVNSELDVKILRAFNPGDIVVIRATRRVPSAVFENIRKQVELFEASSGLRFILLDDSVEIVSREDYSLAEPEQPEQDQPRP